MDKMTKQGYGYTIPKNCIRYNLNRKVQSKIIKCVTCEKVCQNQSDLEEHLKFHAHNKCHPCQKCCKHFSRHKDLGKHEKEHAKSS